MEKCCELHRKVHKKLKTEIAVMYKLMGGNPRHWVSFYNILIGRGMTATAISAALNPEERLKAE